MNKCPKCGIQTDGAFCPECGTVTVPVNNPAPTFTPPAQPVKKEITADMLPEQYRPLSPWAYFGLMLLFSVPIVGFIFLIVFSFKNSNINRRNFARSFWCGLLIAAICFVIMIVLALIFGNSASGGSLFESIGDFFSNLFK